MQRPREGFSRDSGLPESPLGLLSSRDCNAGLFSGLKSSIESQMHPAAVSIAAHQTLSLPFQKNKRGRDCKFLEICIRNSNFLGGVLSHFCFLCPRHVLSNAEDTSVFRLGSKGSPSPFSSHVSILPATATQFSPDSPPAPPRSSPAVMLRRRGRAIPGAQCVLRQSSRCKLDPYLPLLFLL